jgi:hypothetical protein
MRKDTLFDVASSQKSDHDHKFTQTVISFADRKRLRKVRVQMMTDTGEFVSLAGTLSILLDMYETQRYGAPKE